MRTQVLMQERSATMLTFTAHEQNVCNGKNITIVASFCDDETNPAKCVTGEHLTKTSQTGNPRSQHRLAIVCTKRAREPNRTKQT